MGLDEDDKAAKKLARDLLTRIVEADASELLLQEGRVPQMKVGGEWRDCDLPPMTIVRLDVIAGAITKRNQWSRFPNRNCRGCDCQLLALGIGRFRVSGMSYAHVISLSIRRVYPPTDEAAVPFDPKQPLPALAAEALLDFS